MKLLINASILGKKPTGLGVYAESCISGISRSISSTLISCREISGLPVEKKSPEDITLDSGKIAAVRRIFWSMGHKVDPDRLIYSPTHHGIGNYKNHIITIHDLICLRFPRQHLLQYIFFKFLLPRKIRNCRAVFTVSETSKIDISRTYNYPKDKIFVIPNSVDTNRFSPKLKIPSTNPFILMIGARYPHKNAEEVIENSDAWAGKYRLVIASCQGKYRVLLEKMVKDKGLSKQVNFLDYITNDKLLELYQNCAALVYPSKWEGFGIPPLEALACGTPVIASNIPVHREVLGDAAIFVELGSPSSWKSAFEHLENQKIIETKLFEGNKLLSKYTWDNAAATLERSLLTVEPNLEKTASSTV